MPQPHSVGKEEPRRWIKRYRTEVAASSASVLSTVTAFPLDSVKTRMQTYPYDGALHCVRTTYNAEGMRGFFRGVPPTQARASSCSRIANKTPSGHRCYRSPC